MAITPYLLYEEVGGALKWLSKAFGFRKYGAPMSGPDGKSIMPPCNSATTSS